MTTETDLDRYPRPSAMSEPELVHAYGGIPHSADPVASPGSRNGDLQPDQPSAEDALEAEDAAYDRWVDQQITDRPIED